MSWSFHVETNITTLAPWSLHQPSGSPKYIMILFVLQKLFGYSEEKATELMLDVHHKGRAVVSNGTRDEAEVDVSKLHEYGLWATMQKDF